MIFRAYSRIPLEPYWHDVGFRGRVRLNNTSAMFWMDMSLEGHKILPDEGDKYIDADDQRKLVTVSFLESKVTPIVRSVLDGTHPNLEDAYSKASTDGFGGFPDEYREFLFATALKMEGLATHALQVALWRTGSRGGPPGIEISPFQLYWRKAPVSETENFEEGWKQVPAGAIWAELPSDASYFDLDTDFAKEISLLLNDGTPQPLGHDLLREAWRIRESNPRAALVVAVAAIETGIKQFVATQLPQTEWLLQNLPSPPLEKILNKLLPTVQSKAAGHANVPVIDTAIRKVVIDAVERRNKLVHTGKVEVDSQWLETLFQHARKLLYDLDYHSGHEWVPAVADKVLPWGRGWLHKNAYKLAPGKPPQGNDTSE